MKLAVLGATGSIGRSALDLAEMFPEIEIKALSCGSQVELMAQLVQRHRPELVAVLGLDEKVRLEAILKNQVHRPEVLCGPEGQIAVAVSSEAEVVLSAIVGQAGLLPTYAAVAKGLKVALANKEALVMAGDLLMPLAARSGASIIPVDSEHSAIFQVLGGNLTTPDVRRLILTASGGPFRGLKPADLAKVTLRQALKHPNWSMGPKITCDSATMMNKGLEIIEAHHLFKVPYDRLEVVIHPQSVVHSIVEFIDGSQISQAGPTDMRLALAYALSYRGRWPLLSDGSWPGLKNFQPLNLSEIGQLTFEEPDCETFRALKLARAAAVTGGTAPAVLTCANEEAVGLFLKEAIGFTDIWALVEMVLEQTSVEAVESLEQIFEVAQTARRQTGELARKLPNGCP